ncbi:MAG TPA: hypothetical protein VFC46_12250 [Humisphaera sp.]|nr:hypothetical protein [Humisphaera sp.]
MSIERGVGERVRLILIDGKIELPNREILDELVRRERLRIVPRSELRGKAAAFHSDVNWSSLLKDATGNDDAETAQCKRIARLQESFHVDGESWQWWRRLTDCNPADVLEGLLLLLAEVRGHHREGALACDWLGLLRQAISQTSLQDLPAIRMKLRSLDTQSGS